MINKIKNFIKITYFLKQKVKMSLFINRKIKIENFLKQNNKCLYIKIDEHFFKIEGLNKVSKLMMD